MRPPEPDGPLQTDDDTADLALIRSLDERLVGERRPGLLDPLSAAIVDAVLSLGRIKVRAVAKIVGRDPGTVSRRLRGLLRRAASLERYARVLLGEGRPLPWKAQRALAQAAGFEVIEVQRDGRHVPIEPPRLGAEQWRTLLDLAVAEHGARQARLRQALRVNATPRCPTCGRFVGRRSTGRPRRYCSERCRSRYRRPDG